MSGARPWMKWYGQDWMGDVGLRACSSAARGIWADICSIAQGGEPFGHLTINGKVPNMKTLAKLVGETEENCAVLIKELEENSVFSRNRQGVIYSRKMVRMAKKSAHAKKIGKLGGNPSLSKQKGKSSQDNQADNQENTLNPEDNPEDKQEDKREDKTLEARGYKLESKKEAHFAFTGSVIRLTPFELERWRTVYKNIPDLEAELTSYDDWLDGQDVANGDADWFSRTSSKLRTVNAEYAAKLPEDRKPRTPNPQPEDLDYGDGPGNW